jgi:hypothetical protein
MIAHRMRTIATFEFLALVRTKGWLITTFGMPVFLALYGLVLSIPRWIESRSAPESTVYGVVDPGRVLALDADVESTSPIRCAGSSARPDSPPRSSASFRGGTTSCFAPSRPRTMPAPRRSPGR